MKVKGYVDVSEVKIPTNEEFIKKVANEIMVRLQKRETSGLRTTLEQVNEEIESQLESLVPDSILELGEGPAIEGVLNYLIDDSIEVVEYVRSRRM